MTLTVLRHAVELTASDQRVTPSRPSAMYDQARFFNSGRLGDPTETQSRAWSLSFETSGTFEYVCTPHLPVGMIGYITVLPR